MQIAFVAIIGGMIIYGKRKIHIRRIECLFGRAFCWTSL